MEPDFHAGFFQGRRQGADDIRGVIRNRENPAAPFRFQRTAVCFKEILYRLIVKTGKGAVEKFGIADYTLIQLLRLTGIGHITSAFACDVYFLAQLFIFFKNSNTVAFPGRGKRRHHSCSAAADY